LGGSKTNWRFLK